MKIDVRKLWKHLCFSSAGVAELVDAPDLGSGAERRGGSSPFTRTSELIVFVIYYFKIGVSLINR